MKGSYNEVESGLPVAAKPDCCVCGSYDEGSSYLDRNRLIYNNPTLIK